MKKKLIILSGVAGSGKSTYAKEKLLSECGESCAIVSRDEVRFSMVSEDEGYFSKEDNVFSEWIEQIKKSLLTNEYTIADATHITRGSRDKLFKALSSSLEGVDIIAYVILNDLDTILTQNEQRTGRAYVPPTVIKNMFHSFKTPTLEEGFKEIVYIKNGEIIYIAGDEQNWTPQ